jgi:hypothetical protein
MTTTRLRGCGLLLAVTAVLVGCSGGDVDASSSAEGKGDGDTPNITTACDSVAELATAVLDAQDAETVDEIAATIQPAVDSLVEAADASGDQSLSELAATIHDAFETYLTGAADSREAQAAANLALDRAGGRCIELGYTKGFPEEPDQPN